MNKSFSIKINDKKFRKKLSRAARLAPAETTRALTDITLDLKGEVGRRAPIESGDLRGSAYAKVEGGKRPAGEVGVNAVYALRQHEDLTMRHDRTDGYRRKDGTTVNMVAGGEAKYIEKPLKERLPRYRARLEQVIKNVLK
jgi:hypothetical protein